MKRIALAAILAIATSTAANATGTLCVATSLSTKAAAQDAIIGKNIQAVVKKAGLDLKVFMAKTGFDADCGGADIAMMVGIQRFDKLGTDANGIVRKVVGQNVAVEGYADDGSGKWAYERLWGQQNGGVYNGTYLNRNDAAADLGRRIGEGLVERFMEGDDE